MRVRPSPSTTSNGSPCRQRPIAVLLLLLLLLLLPPRKEAIRSASVGPVPAARREGRKGGRRGEDFLPGRATEVAAEPEPEPEPDGPRPTEKAPAAVGWWRRRSARAAAAAAAAGGVIEDAASLVGAAGAGGGWDLMAFSFWFCFGCWVRVGRDNVPAGVWGPVGHPLGPCGDRHQSGGT